MMTLTEEKHEIDHHSQSYAGKITHHQSCA